MNIGFAQLNATVGDLSANSAKIATAYHELVAQGAVLVLTPELALTGAPLQDLIFKSQFAPQAEAALAELAQQVGEVPLLVGTIDALGGSDDSCHSPRFRNIIAILQKGEPIRRIAKSSLLDHDISTESRTFSPGSGSDNNAMLTLGGHHIGLLIGSELSESPAALCALIEEGAELILNPSAAPFYSGVGSERHAALRALAEKHQRPFLFCNAVGANDQIIFDGGSLALDAQGHLLAQLPTFAEATQLVSCPLSPTRQTRPTPPLSYQPASKEAALFDALCLGLSDYVRKSGFQSVILGLSGGIDSAVTAAIAVHTLGASKVSGVTMPTQYSSQGSVDDSLALAQNLGIACATVPIKAAYDTVSDLLHPLFGDRPADTTEENIQPRLRGIILMALSNKFGHLVLSTGNKSELAVGYCTLYGDMAGGLGLLSDVSKTDVYALAHYINREREIIPRSTVEKPPSAELKPGQVDQDTLPPYDLLDTILALYVEEDLSSSDIIARGFDAETVQWIARRVDFNEYKRAQAATGLKVTKRAFGGGRRMPLAQRFSG